MIAVLLGLAVACAFGSGDFVGGRASTGAQTLSVLAVAQLVSVIGAVALVVLIPATATAHDLAYGFAAGVINVVGLALLYNALARHAAGVVAPVTAIVAAVVPVTWALLRGERPSVLTSIGCVLAIAAGALIAREPERLHGRALARGTVQAALAGAALGSSLIFYASTSKGSGQWPVLAARGTGFVLVIIAATAATRRQPFAGISGTPRLLAAVAGALDVTATALLVVAVRRELVVVVAPLVSLAPGFTVVLAWLVTHERLHRPQRAGFVVALFGLVLVALG